MLALTPSAPPSLASPSANDLRRTCAAALGYDRLRGLAGIRFHGTFLEAGATGTVDATVAVATGYTRDDSRTGALLVTSGYDGVAWQGEDGVVTIDDLPGDEADSLTAAWLGREGEADVADDTVVSAPRRGAEGGVAYDIATFVPTGGSPVELWFDAATHLVARANFFTDAGTLRTDYRNYQRIGGIAVALGEHDTDASGAVSDTTITNVSLLATLPPGALARTAAQDRGHITGPGVVAFTSDATGAEGHVVVPASLGGHLVNVDFDSGGSNAIVPEAATRIGLGTSGGLEVGGVGNDSESATTARVAHLAIGNAVLDDQPFLVLPLPYAIVHPRAGLEVDGLVGFEMLANFRTRIDYARHELSFARFEDAPPPAGRGAVVLPFRSDGHTPYVEAEIDGVRGLFEVDTGANATVTIFDAFAREHGLFKNGGVAYASPGGVGGAVSEQVVRARSFDLAGVRFDQPVIAVAKTKSGAFASRTIAGNIGSAVLSRYTLTFDYRARTIAFEPRPNVTARFPADHTGFGVAVTKPGEIRVLSVAPRSPAADAGLAAGDRIVALDGRAARDEDLLTLGSLRGGTRAFRLTLERGDRRLDAEVVPRDVLGGPQ